VLVMCSFSKSVSKANGVKFIKKTSMACVKAMSEILIYCVVVFGCRLQRRQNMT